MKKISFLLIFSLLIVSDAWAMGRRPAQSAKQPENVKLSLDLWDCYLMAMQRSETLAIRKEEVSRTWASFLESSGEIIGDADFVMTQFNQDPQKGTTSADGSVGGTLQASERRERRFVLSQPVFRGFKALGAISGAGSLKKSRISEWERAKQLLFLDVVNAFYDYRRYDQEVEIIEGIISLFEDRIEDLKAWEDIGRSRPSELSTVQSRYRALQAELANVKGDRAVAGNLLAFLIGVRVQPEELEDSNVVLKPEEDEDVLALASVRHDVDAARHAVQTARGKVIIAQSELWPEISVDGNLYEHREGFQSGTSWDTLLTFNIPLGKGGTTFAKIKDAWSDWKEAKLTHSLTERTALREIQDAYENWKSARDRYEYLRQAVGSAQENFTFQQDDYKRRLVNNLDVLDALEVLFRSRRDENLASFDMKKNYWELEVAKGHCCSQEETLGAVEPAAA